MASVVILTGTLRQSGSSTWAIALTEAFQQEGHQSVLLGMGGKSEVDIPDTIDYVCLNRPRSNFLIKLSRWLLLNKLAPKLYKKAEAWIANNRVKQFLAQRSEQAPVDLVIKDFTHEYPACLDSYKTLSVIHQMMEDAWHDSGIRARAQDPVTAFASVSQATMENAQQFGISVEKVLYNPIPTEQILARADEFEVEGDFIIFVGALNKGKGVYYLLEAFAQANIDKDLYFIGRGNEEEGLKKRAEELGVADRVNFLGFMRNPLPYVKQAKMLLLLSVAWEAMPYVLAEALILNTPVIAGGFRGAEELCDPAYIVNTEGLVA